MLFNFSGLLLLLLLVRSAATDDDFGFIFNGFKNDATSFNLDGTAEITPKGLLRLTGDIEQQPQNSHAFYLNPIQFKNLPSDGNTSTTTNSTTTTVYPFSTTFVFALVPKSSDLRGPGIAFFIAPPTPRGFTGALPGQFLGLFNDTNNGNSTNHVVAVELDTILNPEFGDVNNNHVGIDINGLRSTASSPARYFTNKTGDGGYTDLNLTGGKPMQVWVEYDGVKRELNVTLAPFKVPKPKLPLLSSAVDLSPVILDNMYVGFSSATGNFSTSSYILGWSFKINGQAHELDLSQLPELLHSPWNKSKIFKIVLPIIITILGLITMCCIFLMVRRGRSLAEMEDEFADSWEPNYRSHRFSYKDLYMATKGFRQKELIGIGGFGKVYKGVLPTSKIEVAVKRVSHNSEQGMKEFVAEIVSIGQLRHRNLVQLLGYSRRKGELLLVYELMPNGSLDRFLFSPLDSSIVLDWNHRFRIIKGVASGLLYLHEECDQVVIHRDIKASNVLLDNEMNARLSDFGLARLHDHGANPHTTRVAGTLGYLAPEMFKTRKFTTSTDVYAFGAFLLEVGCGRRPIEQHKTEPEEDLILFDWVFSCWKKGSILETSDPKLRTDYVIKEMELVLKLGLLCSHNVPESRPSMKQVVQYLDGGAVLPVSELGTVDVNVGLRTDYLNFNSSATEISEDLYSVSYASLV